jgi:hypothetical protein
MREGSSLLVRIERGSGPKAYAGTCRPAEAERGCVADKAAPEQATRAPGAEQIIQELLGRCDRGRAWPGPYPVLLC